jgi:hypothetical protein
MLFKESVGGDFGLAEAAGPKCERGEYRNGY